MVAFSDDTGSRKWLAVCQALFEQMLPQIRREVNLALRAVPADQREGLIEEVVQRAFGTFLSLAERGKIQIAYAKPLAMTAVKQVRTQQDERRLG